MIINKISKKLGNLPIFSVSKSYSVGCEFTEKCLWYFGYVDDNGDKCYEENTFVEIERKYFEGFNLPRKIVNGKMESFDDSYNRMKRWYGLSYNERRALA
jgi:hypothetical protein